MGGGGGGGGGLRNVHRSNAGRKQRYYIARDDFCRPPPSSIPHCKVLVIFQEQVV